MATTSQFLPVAKSELDFFRPRHVQVSQVGCETIPLKPINSVNAFSKRLEFYHPGKNTDFYRNLSNTFLYLKFKVAKPDGTPVESAKKAAVVNYIGQTIISSLEISLNGTVVTRNTDNYQYRAYIEALLTGNDSDAACHLAAGGFRLDTGTGAQITDFDDANNTGCKSRYDWVKDGNAVEVISRLHTDIGKSHLYLPSGLDLSVNLNLTSDAFLLMAASGVTASDVAFHLVDSTLYTEIVHVNPAVQTAIERVFLDRNAIIPIQNVEVHAINVSAGQKHVSVDNLFTGKLPSVMLIGIVENSVQAGTLTKNSFVFKHLDLTNLNVYVNGTQHALGPFDFSKKNCVLGYHSLLKASGLLSHGESPMVTQERYMNGFSLWGFDLSPEGAAASHGTHSSVQRVGSIRLEALFETAPTVTTTFLIYSIKEGSSIEIDKMRNIYLSF